MSLKRVDGGKNAVTKVPVSERALLQRINRTLQKQGQALKKGRVDNPALGAMYVVDLAQGAVKTPNVDLEAFGRELGALQAWETLAP